MNTQSGHLERSSLVRESIVASLLTLVAFCASQPEPLQVVHGSGYIGAIFPASRGSEARIFLRGNERVEGYWTPTRTDVADLESRLGPALRAAVNDAAIVLGDSRDSETFLTFVQDQVVGIIGQFDSYGRQYVGITVGGSKRIFVNCFGIFGYGQGEDPAFWRTRFVDFTDGGLWYWRIQFDLQTKRFLGFSANGVA